MLPVLFIGRFQPFHIGHADAVAQILAQYKKIIIGIGSAQYAGDPKNPFPFAMRKQMIEESLSAAGIMRKRFAIKAIPDIHDDARWVAHVEKLVPKFGTVVSGSPKVRRLFKKDGKHAVQMPEFRRDVSGTKVREMMKKRGAWEEFVPRAVKKIITLYRKKCHPELVSGS